MAGLPVLPSIECPQTAAAAGLQGIARVAVDDANARLTVVFQSPLTLPAQNFLLDAGSYMLSGGQRIFPRILRAELPPPSSPPAPNTSVVLTLDTIGDFSIYTLTVSGPGMDPFFSSRKLRFRLACDDRFDCKPAPAAATPAEKLAVNIDYLAKDYASFRQALLDFIPTRLPDWTERSEADMGMMLLELFAATADNLSYLQDRVANEAYLGTATQRRSVAGHLALIGYQMDEGAAAHTWLQFQVSAAAALPADFQVSNAAGDGETRIVFELLGTVRLDPAFNQVKLFSWGNSGCHLPAQSVSVALAGQFDQLSAGDYLLFDGGQGQRDVVRLTAAPEVTTANGTTITVVTWSAATPLTADYDLDRTIVRGNLAPATHGATVSEALRSLKPAQATEIRRDLAALPPGRTWPRQRLKLAQAPLAHLDPSTYALGNGLASSPETADFTSRSARSISTLQVEVNGETWTQQATLLNSGSGDRVFRLEIDDSGEATVVFGDGVFGAAPAPDSTVTATYRAGGGAAGNTGADTLKQASSATSMDWLLAVTNPVAATGGRDLESADHARRVAPATFQNPLVAVTGADYEDAAAAFRDAGGVAAIQRATADFRWTGSWLTVTLAADPMQAEGLTTELKRSLLQFLQTRRLAGYDLEVTGPKYVPVELELSFTAQGGAERADVEQALLAAFHQFFQPDQFTFGGPLYASRIYAAAMAVPGVSSVEITRFSRLHALQPDRETAINLEQGFLAVGSDEIVRLDNDANFPQNGTLSVVAS